MGVVQLDTVKSATSLNAINIVDTNTLPAIAHQNQLNKDILKASVESANFRKNNNQDLANLVIDENL